MSSDLLMKATPKYPFGEWDKWYIEKYLETLEEFRALIRQQPTEHKVQAFLESQPWYLLHAAMDGFYTGATSTRSTLFPKFKLGNEYETDFLFCNGSSLGLSCTFIELERPDVSLFTRRGDPTKHLAHAIRQIVNWNAWLIDNHEFALKEIARAVSPNWSWPPILRKPFRYLIIIGRRQSLNEKSNRLRVEICNMNPGLEIITYDRLCDDYGFDKLETLNADEHRTVRDYPPKEASQIDP